LTAFRHDSTFFFSKKKKVAKKKLATLQLDRLCRFSAFSEDEIVKI